VDFVREIIEADQLIGIIDIPEKLRHSPVEIIILPVMEKENIPTKELHEKQPRNERYKELYENPIGIKKIKQFSREELYER